MIVIDASVWVSHLIAQEIHHVVSRRWLTAVVHSKKVKNPVGKLGPRAGCPCLWRDYSLHARQK